MKLRALFSNYMDDTWVSHIALSVLGSMRGAGLEVSLVSHASDPPGRRDFTEDGVPPALRRLVYRFDRRQRLVHAWTKRRFLRGVPGTDAVYLWPDAPIEIYRAVRSLGVPIFNERVNCHRIVQRRVLCREFAELGLDPEAHAVSPLLQAREDAKLALCDYVFAPSPMVVDSLVEGGVPRQKIIASSYGWSPQRLRPPASPRRDGRFTVVFVGTLCIRKGVHRLLRAWDEARIDGDLLLAGEIGDLGLVPGIDALLARPGVKQLGYVSDIGSVYAGADLFAFPSLEEGGPLVTYEAMACGLPTLVSPMGAGAVVRADRDGLVCEPVDHDGWVDALRRLAADRDLRRQLGDSGRQQVQQFTWEQVGARRRQAVLSRLRSDRADRVTSIAHR